MADPDRHCSDATTRRCPETRSTAPVGQRSPREPSGTFLTNDMDAARATLKDDYNADADPTNWSTYADGIRANIAVFDGLDEDLRKPAARGSRGHPLRVPRRGARG